MKRTRRTFLKHTGQLAVGVGLLGIYSCNEAGGDANKADSKELASAETTKGLFFKISLAEWSFHRALKAGKMDNRDFAATAKNVYGIDAIEYVNQFFKDKAKDQAYLTELKKRADDNGVYTNLIMIDGEGGMAEVEPKKLQQSLENHYKWVDAAKFLGCQAIRVNAFSTGSPEEAAKAAVDGLSTLAEYAAKVGLNVIVENHGGFTSNGEWLSGVMKQINLPNCGTLPDFGNFCTKRTKGVWEGDCVEEYDRYKGVTEMMPFAKAVSAKSYGFDAEGNETTIDYSKMLKIVKDAGYTSYIGIEYEGETMSEDEGIRATKALLERVGKSIS